MLYICLFLYFIFSIFIPENKSVTNGRFATYHKTKRELLSRDTFSRAAFDSSEGMSENQKDRYISYLVDRVNEMDLDKRAMELVLEDFLKAKKEMQEELSVMKKRQEQLDSRLDTETKKRKKAEQRVEQLENQLAFARKNQFGDKRQKVKNANEDESNGENPDRNDEQEKFDGTDDTLETKSVPEPSDAPVSKKRRRGICAIVLILITQWASREIQ